MFPFFLICIDIYFIYKQYKMRKIRLTESQLHNVIKETVKSIIREISDGTETMEEYNPWMNGDASYIDGNYDIEYGFHVEIDTRYSTVSIEKPDDEENSYFLQGDEADDLIKQIAYYWSNGNCTRGEAVNAVISGLF